MTSVIILAAGKGERMNLGYNKMNLLLDGVPMYEFIIKRFLSLGYEDIILVSNEDISYPNVRVVRGGKERMNSVYNGLLAIKGEYVIIHDGARPFVSNKAIENVQGALKKYDAVILAHKVTDTVKYISDENGLETLDRKKLISAETPQAFKSDVIKEAYHKAIRDEFLGTDDSSIYEKYCSKEVFVVYNDEVNIKLTKKEDLDFAHYLLKKDVERCE